jgi:uptake hydrogenase large subunit
MSGQQPDTGSVTLAAAIVDGSLQNVRVQSRRPAVATLLAGRPPSMVQTMLPLLYAICRRAQGAATAAALAVAGGTAVPAGVNAAVAAEAVRELLFAALTAEARRPLAEAQRRLFDAPALRSYLQEEAFGMSLDEWYALQDEAGLLAWADSGNAPLQAEARRRLALPEPPAAEVRLLSMVEAATVSSGMPVINAGVAAQPSWNGEPAETGALVRQQAHSLVARLAARPLLQRWMARLADLVQHVRADGVSTLGRVSAASTDEGVGMALVETARGSLLHRARLHGGVVSDYVIVAPTEWNFHPQGPIRAWLEGRAVAGPAAAREWLHRAAEALDPCVVCQLLVE